MLACIFFPLFDFHEIATPEQVQEAKTRHVKEILSSLEQQEELKKADTYATLLDQEARLRAFEKEKSPQSATYDRGRRGLHSGKMIKIGRRMISLSTIVEFGAVQKLESEEGQSLEELPRKFRRKNSVRVLKMNNERPCALGPIFAF